MRSATFMAFSSIFTLVLGACVVQGGGSGGDGGSSGGMCTPGDTRPGDGGCGECVCQDDGEWLCPEVGCGSSTGDPPIATSTSTGQDATTGDPGVTTGDGTTGTTEDTVTTGSSSDTDTTTGGVDPLPACVDLLPSDPFELVGVVVDGDDLVVDLAYSGGCEVHDFVLCVDAVDREGLVHLVLDHENHGDACESYPMEQHKFDLRGLQGLGASPLALALADWPDPLSYAF